MANKEVVLLEKKVDSALALSQTIEINDDKTLVKGIDFLKNIKTVGKAIKQQKDKLLVPARNVVTEIRDMFRVTEGNFAEAEKNVKKKILTYNLKVEEANRIKEEKIAARVEKKTLKPETAVRKMEEIKEAPTQGNVGKVSMRTVRKVEITDETLIPRKYLSLNMVLIRKAALAGVVIPGTKVVEEKTLAGY